ncbi:DUF2194 domain-containing protein [Fodinibius halophilus]|uniref:DUF2194 domain-containing protein n=1 Tax=Fodinibius halophilus TaxID=1736908 RepID=A0A6M1TA98_9BACT|nr:DUF2194 domain-containing protein [Fodinibius halophilus]NGP87894.1 DUF2194 domain-containing protein [Fodinibius halophilus]
MNRLGPHLCAVILIVATISGCRWGCSSDSKTEIPNFEESEPLAMVVKNRFDSSSISINSNVTHALEYAKIPYQTFDFTLGASQLTIPESIKLLYLTTDRVEQIEDQEVERLLQFVAEGGEIVILTPLYDERFQYFTGIDPRTDPQLNKQAEGFVFQEHIFPHYKGEQYQNRATFIHNGFGGEYFVDEKAVLATASSDRDYPAIIEREVGKGRAIYFNTTVMTDKSYRGLLFSTGLKALEGIPYRVANVSTIFLDDFPAPLYNEKLEPVDEEYDTTHADFVARIWWPEMKELANNYDMDYTAVIAFNYNAVVVPPFDFKEWKFGKLMVDGEQQNASAWIARDIRDSRHELGLHGYNHFSLWKEDWDNIQFMQASLQAVKKRWRIDNLGDFPVSYVPPTNNIDSLGLQAVSLTLPSVKYMSSIYLGSFEEGGDREFGPEPFAPELFDYPRITSGYVNSDASNFNQNNLFLITGIWTHFVHPDDVFQVKKRSYDKFRSRNPRGLGWHSNEEYDFGLYEVFKRRLDETLERYPLSRFRAVKDAAPIAQRWLNTYSRYEFSDNVLKVSTLPLDRRFAKNKVQYWFSYVSEENQSTVENALAASNITFERSPLWDGVLYQFKTTADTLEMPVLESGDSTNREQLVSNIKKEYEEYLNPPADEIEETQQWRDERLDKALAAYSNKPNNRKLKEKVISLAIEFDRTPLAITVLERQLMNDGNWYTKDIARLLKYYGWEGAADRAYTFTEKLWEKYRDSSILKFKDMVTDRFGIPDQKFQDQWLQRAYNLSPDDPELLKTLLQESDTWEKRKKYIKELIELNPNSDSLYGYAIEQSIFYADADQTITLLQSFPDSAFVEEQLDTYADQIAYRYAEKNQLTRAGMWAQKTDSIAKETELGWLMQQQRYKAFIDRSTQYLEQSPENDSLRTYVGQQLIYAEFRDKGYSTLYPLFTKNKASQQSRQLVHNEVGYMGYEKQKSFYRQYPAFFSDSLAQSISDNYRKNEGFRAGSEASFTSDNFDNNTGSLGLFGEWGDRRNVIHKVSLNDRYVSSKTLNNNRLDYLYNVKYQWRKSFNSQASQLKIGGGIYSENNAIKPGLQAGYWFAEDSTYTSIDLEFQPVFTNSGLQQDINKIKGAIYREDYWISNRFQTTLSLNANWYSDNNYSYEGLLKLYYEIPFANDLAGIRPLADISYANSKVGYLRGVPYYTPDNLFVKGVGIDLNYKNERTDPSFTSRIEILGKHSNRDGTFLAATGTVKAQVNDYWSLSLNGYLSTSKIYRYNSLSLSISYIFPRALDK